MQYPVKYLSEMLLTVIFTLAITTNLASGIYVPTSREIDEEEINKENGLAKNPHMYGDLILTPDQEKKMIDGRDGTVQGFLYSATKWPGGEVPFELGRALNSKAKEAINAAMDEFEKKSCIRFKQRTYSDPDYVYFTADRGCYSLLGMSGGRQVISIGDGCEYKGIVQHEILHALGRIHEQNRSDRNYYVKIYERNIIDGMLHNFEIMNANQQGLPYDYGSVMHYGAYDFSSNGRPVIIPYKRVKIGQRKGLSSTDWTHLKEAYCS